MLCRILTEKKFWKQFKKEFWMNKKKINRKKIYFKFLKYAAVLILFFSLGYYYSTFQIQSVNNRLIIPNEEDIVLTTSDGKKIILNENQNEIEIESKLSLKKNSTQLNYNKSFKVSEEVKKPVLHTLEVPFGKRYKIVLSDGTLVHLNSGSKLKYPVKFDKKKPRVVFLEGEAFFDVAERKNQIFSVNTVYKL